MNDWNLPWEGGCRCGQVRFRISAPPLLTMACHCKGCQRLAASAFSLTVTVPSAGFALIQGEPILGGLQTQHRHEYCPHCKSWIFTRPHGLDYLVNVRATMLDDASWYVPYIEMCTSEKLPWATTPAVHHFEQFPPPDVFGWLIPEFQQKGARPAPR